MATNFPTALDTFTNPTSLSHLDDVPVLHSAQHANENDSILALQAKTGIDFSAVANSLDYITKMLLATSGQHQEGGYRELIYVGDTPFVSTITWYTNAGKTIKLVEKEFTYGGAITILPSSVALRLYNGTVANTLMRTLTDTIVYNTVFETSRTRVVT